MAAQSTTTSGWSRRGPSRCSASAAPSLPVPVSPSSSTVASVAAAFSISAKAARIGVDRPTSGPSSNCSESGCATRSSSSCTRSTVRPNRSSAPSRSHASATRVPSTQVPLRDSRSRTRAAPSSSRISQWKRETVWSDSTTSFFDCCPIDDCGRARSPTTCPLASSSRSLRTAGLAAGRSASVSGSPSSSGMGGRYTRTPA
jgi:hypothetical protein